MLWSQRAREQARGSLRQSVHELQRALGPGAGALLQTDRNHLVLADKDLWVDVGVVAAATVADPAGLQVFRPTLLDDLDGLDPVFDGWLEEQRQRVTQLALSVTEAVLAAESETKARIAAAERLLTIDRAHEGAWQALIRAHLELGDRAAARARVRAVLGHSVIRWPCSVARDRGARSKHVAWSESVRSLVAPTR